MDYIMLANGALSLLELLIPKIAALANSGHITVDQQKAVKDRYNTLKASMDTAFAGPEWKIDV